MRRVHTCFSRSLSPFLLGSLLLGCSALGNGPGDGEGNGARGDGSDPSNPFGTIEIGGIFDVDFKPIEKPFWTPPAFTGDGCQGQRGPWGEAVQKSLWFLNVNRSGPGITHSFVQWRGDSHLEDGHILLEADAPTGVNMSEEYIEKWRHVFDPDENGELDMAGGYYDAGDFLKIGITSNYMVATLGWTMWTFPESFDKTGMRSEALSVMRWWADFALKNTYVENPNEPDPWKWNVVGYGHQVGGASDHDCGWMPPELRRAATCPRKGYLATHENPSADVTAGAAAALALVAWHFRGEDPEYATKALNTAIALYEFAKLHHGTTWDTDGLYQSESSYDDLGWAAVWLHEVLPSEGQPGANEQTALYASHKEGYLQELIGDSSETGHDPWVELFRNGAGLDLAACKTDSAGTCWSESWTHIWNSNRSGVFLKLAEILKRHGNRYGSLGSVMQGIARRDSLAWLTGPHTEGGFAKKVDVSWGSGRYNSAGQMIALTYARTFPEDIVPDQPEYEDQDLIGKNTADLLVPWAKRQSEYLLGDNPLGESYMMGFSDNYSTSAHHAATHASIYGLCGEPVESKHIAYGALVSGPNAGDEHSNDRCDYGANEITIDYNAAFIGALAGNYFYQGQDECPDPNFPPVEKPFDEFYTKARINSESDCSTQVEVTLVNETAHPPRFDPTIKYRYYIDASELQNKGIDPSELTARVIYENYAEEPAMVSELKACSLNTSTYYWEFSYPYEFWGEQIWLRGPRVALIDIGVGDDASCTYDKDNDWSASPLSDKLELSPSVPAYSEDFLVWGAEPECDEPPKVVIPPVVTR